MQPKRNNVMSNIYLPKEENKNDRKSLIDQVLHVTGGYPPGIFKILIERKYVKYNNECL